MYLNLIIDPILSNFVILSLVIIVVGFLLRILKQPSVITYIIVGVIVGPHILEVIKDESLISNLGSLGLVLLLFFIGMEIHLPNLISNWKVSIIGTFFQIVVSVFVLWLLSFWFDWQLNQIIMLGFVISLSSTAVIIKLLQERNELNSKVGQMVLGVLLAQDIFIVPMLIIINYLGGHKPDGIEIIKQMVGGVLIVGLIIYIIYKKEIKIPFQSYIKKDHEMQVFLAFSLCFGFSIITAFLGLSAALGAFVGGIVLSATKSTKWIHDSLGAFKTMFVALFFVSVGMIIDLIFLKNNALTIGVLVLLVFVLNNTINVIVLRFFCKDWKISFYAGALLSQIGEFSFIISSTGYYTGIIEDYAYQLTISTIALTLLFSPFWIGFSKRILKIANNRLTEIPVNKKTKYKASISKPRF